MNKNKKVVCNTTHNMMDVANFLLIFDLNGQDIHSYKFGRRQKDLYNLIVNGVFSGGDCEVEINGDHVEVLAHYHVNKESYDDFCGSGADYDDGDDAYGTYLLFKYCGESVGHGISILVENINFKLYSYCLGEFREEILSKEHPLIRPPILNPQLSEDNKKKLKSEINWSYTVENIKKLYEDVDPKDDSINELRIRNFIELHYISPNSVLSKTIEEWNDIKNHYILKQFKGIGRNVPEWNSTLKKYSYIIDTIIDMKTHYSNIRNTLDIIECIPANRLRCMPQGGVEFQKHMEEFEKM